jgi:hypothetical protein
MPRSFIRFSLACALQACAALVLSNTPGHAHAQSVATPAQAAAMSLGDPHSPADDERPPAHTSSRGLAGRSLVGPSMEMVAGGVTLGMAPVVGIAAALMAGPGILECLSFDDDDEEDARCEAEAERKRQRGRRLAIGLSVPMAAVGVVLLGHGGHRVRMIKQARRVRFQDAAVELEEGRASLLLRASF